MFGTSRLVVEVSVVDVMSIGDRPAKVCMERVQEWAPGLRRVRIGLYVGALEGQERGQDALISEKLALSELHCNERMHCYWRE